MPFYSNIIRVSVELGLSPVIHVQFIKTDDQNAGLFMSSAANESFLMAAHHESVFTVSNISSCGLISANRYAMLHFSICCFILELVLEETGCTVQEKLQH